MAALSRIRAWDIPQMEEAGGHSPWGHKESDRTARLHTSVLPKEPTSVSLLTGAPRCSG